MLGFVLKIFRRLRERLGSRFGVAELMGVLCMLLYCSMFYSVIGGRWFNSNWTTDDAAQQQYLFHEVQVPGLFKNDPISDYFRTYVPPLHSALTWHTTRLVGDPILAGHWIMLLQLGGLLLVAFLFVRRQLGLLPASLAVVWLLHSRHMIQRIALGLPRGWPPLLLVGGLYYMAKRSPAGVAFVMLASVLLNAPAALIVGASYGLLLLWEIIDPKTRADGLRQLKMFIPLAALVLAAMFVVHSRPKWIGEAVSLEVAQNMPEMYKPAGRFPLVPLSPAKDELRHYGFMAFISVFHKDYPEIKERMPEVVFALFLIGIFYGLIRDRRMPMPREVFVLGLGSIATYFVSRWVAFKLFIPDRYLLAPMTIFFVFAGIFMVATLCRSKSTRLLGGFLIFSLVWLGSGNGLQGDLNFNKHVRMRSLAVWHWISKNLPTEAVLGGQPTTLDMAMLVGQRRAYINTEAAHPIFTGYYAFIKPRIELSLRAVYAKSLSELSSVLDGSGITHFIFKRDLFYANRLDNAKYFPPFDILVKDLTKGPHDQYAYREIQGLGEQDLSDLIVYRDPAYIVISVAGLKRVVERSRTNAQGAS